MLSALSASQVYAQERVAIGTGGTGGVFYAVGAGMAELLCSRLPGVTANAEVTGASMLTMLASFVLGMGMPTSGAYLLLAILVAILLAILLAILVAILVAPALVRFDVPVIAAEMIVTRCAGALGIGIITWRNLRFGR